KKALGKTIEVTVTSVLQTTAGKMIFCRWTDAGAVEDTRRGERRDDRRDSRAGNGGRDYRGGGRREERITPIAARPVTVAPVTPLPLSSEAAASEAGTAPIPVTPPSTTGTTAPIPGPAAALATERPAPKGD